MQCIFGRRSFEFCSYYFEEHVSTKHRSLPRNYDGPDDVEMDEDPDRLEIFKHHGRSFGKKKTRFLTDQEYNAAHIYVLLNCSEVEPFIDLFADAMKTLHPNLGRSEIDSKLDKEFASWFFKHALDHANNVTNKYLRDLSKGPHCRADTFHGFYVNGYKFHTLTYATQRSSMNSGVCIKGANYGTNENDYHGRLLEMAPRGRGTVHTGRGVRSETLKSTSKTSIGVSTPMDHLHIGEGHSTYTSVVPRIPEIGSIGADVRIWEGIQSGKKCIWRGLPERAFHRVSETTTLTISRSSHGLLIKTT